MDWLLREDYRERIGGLLDRELTILVHTSGYTVLPASLCASLRDQKLEVRGEGRKGPPWKVLVDPHIHWANAQARKRLPTKAPESDAFRAEVICCLKNTNFIH